MKQKRKVYGGHGALELLKLERKKFKGAIDALAVVLQGMIQRPDGDFTVYAKTVSEARAALAAGLTP